MEGKPMRNRFAGLVIIALVPIAIGPANACDLIEPKRPPTIAEQVAGLETIFGGTVIGYVTAGGDRLMGPIPASCLDDAGDFPWWDWDKLPASCEVYRDTSAALFRVDTAIVGPAAGAVVPHGMTWGDGDCNLDFVIGEQWLIAGGFTQQLRAPIRDSETALLQDLAAHPPFDFKKLYR
jgi:hypothetical protein